MIQEKDFLYRVPVKTAPITTPKGQIRNPEILVDLEGGEFMHGNILDANSTNKLINQSVKEAVDNKIIESGYVTKDLLDAETSARTNGDEDLSNKIKEEQTRAEGKEKEISDKLAIVDGDSNTEGSFRKAIADVVAAAPEDLDTLKEIADKLADSDDLHNALNQAITEKADSSALANEVTRATSAESNLQAAIDAKQDAGNYIPYDSTDTSSYDIDRTIKISGELGYTTLDNGHIGFYSNNGDNLHLMSGNISTNCNVGSFQISTNGINTNDGRYKTEISNVYGFSSVKLDGSKTATFSSDSCISLKSGDQDTLSLNYGGLQCKVSGENKINIDPRSINQVTSSGYALSIDQTKIKQVANSYTFDVNSSDGIKWSQHDGSVLSQINQNGLYARNSDTSYAMCNIQKFIDINNGGGQAVLNPSNLFITNNTSSFEINSIAGAIQLLSGTSDDSTGLKLGYNGLRIGEKADINADNGELISISRQHNAIPYIFKVKDNTIETNKVKIDEFGLTNDKSSVGNSSHALYITNSALHGAILVESNANLSIGNDNYILDRPYWKFGYQGAEFNGSDDQKRIDIQGAGFEYANIFGIKLSTNVQQSSGTWDDPCQIQNNSDYVLFSKKIKVSDIITDATTDSSLNTVLSKKVNTETFNSFSSSVSGQLSSFNGAISTFSGALSTFSEQIASKQDKITPTTELDLTSIDTADVESLRSIVKALATELNTLGLIKLKSAEETA